ncbi:MAG: hypothetical protein DMF68_13590 [Acidobacteria bacterium]|nr:MAG: hypothetical protein DMF68_13590 [Acidobacteriota bacterium]
MAANEVDVIFRIRGDSSLVGADFANANSSIKAGEARLQAELSSSYGKYTADLRSATDVLIAESEKAIASAERVALGASQSIKNTSSALTTASQEASSFGSVVSGLAGTASIWIGAASAVFYFTEKLNQAAAQLYDLHTKVNLSVETLSALKNAAETSGSSITNLSASLGIFDKNMEKAREGQKQMSALFKSLNVDTSDNEKALRQVFEVLSKMPESEEQTAIAMQLFGRSGKDVLGVLKEMHGDLDGAIEKYRQMGTLISTETAKAADEFRDSLKQTGQSALALGRDLLETLAPALKIIIGLLQAVVETLRLVVDLVNLLLSAPILAFAENLKNTLGVIYDTAAKASEPQRVGQGAHAQLVHLKKRRLKDRKIMASTCSRTWLNRQNGRRVNWLHFSTRLTLQEQRRL